MLVHAIDREGRKIPVRLAADLATPYMISFPGPSGRPDDWPLKPGSASRRLWNNARIAPIVRLHQEWSGEPFASDLVTIADPPPPPVPDLSVGLPIFVAMVYCARPSPFDSGRIWVAEFRFHCDYELFKVDPGGFPIDKGYRIFAVLDDDEARDWLEAYRYAIPVEEHSDTAPAPGTEGVPAGKLPEDPGSRALAAAYALLKADRPVSLKAACKKAGVDRKNIQRRYPDVVAMIKKVGAPDRSLPSGSIDRRTGNLEAEADD